LLLAASLLALSSIYRYTDAKRDHQEALLYKQDNNFKQMRESRISEILVDCEMDSNQQQKHCCLAFKQPHFWQDTCSAMAAMHQVVGVRQLLLCGCLAAGTGCGAGSGLTGGLFDLHMEQQLQQVLSNQQQQTQLMVPEIKGQTSLRRGRSDDDWGIGALHMQVSCWLPKRTGLSMMKQQLCTIAVCLC